MLLLWVKAFHIIAVVSWFAVLFYLPRLFVYHAACEDTAGKERFKIMERKLYRAIGTPSIIAVWVLGGWLVSFQWEYLKTQGWFHTKFLLVLLLTGYHHMCGAYIKKFAREDFTPPSHVFFRWFNEVPVFFLMAIVILVVVRPF